jgi:hypothetical protein
MTYPLLARRYPASKLMNRILFRGRDEQELQYLFPSLYGGNAVTKNTAGQYKTFNRQLKRGKYAVYF